jgi:hypothetical protein
VPHALRPANDSQGAGSNGGADPLYQTGPLFLVITPTVTVQMGLPNRASLFQKRWEIRCCGVRRFHAGEEYVGCNLMMAEDIGKSEPILSVTFSTAEV